MLDNISVNENDLRKLYPKLDVLLANEAVNFTDIITDCKKDLFIMVKQEYIGQNMLYDDRDDVLDSNASIDTTLETVRDYTNEEYLKRKLVRMALSKILLMSEDYEGSEAWNIEAQRIPLRFYVDEDEDQTADLDEEYRQKRYGTFHR